MDWLRLIETNTGWIAVISLLAGWLITHRLTIERDAQRDERKDFNEAAALVREHIVRMKESWSYSQLPDPVHMDRFDSHLTPRQRKAFSYAMAQFQMSEAQSGDYDTETGSSTITKPDEPERRELAFAQLMKLTRRRK